MSRRSAGFSRVAAAVLFVLFVLPAVVGANDAVTGRIVDHLTKKPVRGALITVGSEVVQSDAAGLFTLRAAAGRIGVRAPGYQRAEMPVPASAGRAPFEVRLQPFSPKALYLTYFGIGDRGLRGNALKLIGETELNALVIDVKGDRGVLTYKSSVPLVAQVGAQKQVIVKDVRGLIQSLKERGIYTIARIVVFKDDVLGAARPELAIRTQEGKIWRDRENLIWVDPSRKEVWDYNIQIAMEAAQNGFDEIQFDYVRFPDRRGLKFAVANTEENRVNAISGFLTEARKRLTPYNVFLAADIFGYVPWNLDDTQIGQRLDRIVPCVDYVSLMLYPSGFQFGIPGYRNPVAHPYHIVSLSLKRAQERTNIPTVRFRPWLQAFRDYAFDRRYFYGPEIRTQIKAAEEFGSGGWMLWNPRNAYMADGLKRRTLSGSTSAKQNGSSG
ncbi:MAG: putative glycoside hydrolase [Thermodesulfovibrionales bacterium]